MSNKGNLIILSAPSGSGKTSLAHRLLKEQKDVSFSVSYTTRPRRTGEKEGIDYFFVSPRQFSEMVDQGAFLEWAFVYENYYGTSRSFVEERLQAGRDVLLDIDVQGARKVWQQVPEAVTVFVLPPSFHTLRERLVDRGLDDSEVIRKRLACAREEIQCYREYQYLIVNDEMERAVMELQSIIGAARCRVPNRQAQAAEIVKTFLDQSWDDS